MPKRQTSGLLEGIRSDHEKADQLNRMIAWEQGDLDMEQTCELFQDLVNSGLAWKLQGCYGRTAKALIEEGFIEAKS